MSRELVISAAPHETRVSIIEDGQLCEIYIEREKEFALVGSIYKGRVTRVLPGMQSAFVDIGLDSDAFLYVGDFLENLEDYDHVSAAVEGKVEKMEQQGGAVFAAPVQGEGAPAPEAAAPSAPETFEGSDAVAAKPASQSDSGWQPAPPAPSHQPSARPPFESRDRGGDRGHGGGGFGRGPRGDRDRGRGGRGGRGGRWQRGRGGRPQGGRDLPPSKYASPRPFSPRPPEPAGGEPDLPADFAPVILPGESLAKYKDRASSPHLPPEPSEIASGSVESAGMDAAAKDVPSLPSSLYAGTEQTPAAPSASDATAHPNDWRWQTPRRGTLEPPPFPPQVDNEPPEVEAQAETGADEESHEEFHAPEAPIETHAHGNGSEVTEEEMAALGERLAEARHEETTASADADEVPGEPESEEAAVLQDEGEGEELAHDDLSHDHDDERTEEEAQEDAAALAAAGGFIEPVHTESVEAETEGEAVQPDSSSAERPMSARISEPQRARFQRPMRRGGRNRDRGHQDGRRREHHGGGGGHRPQQQRRPQLISEVLKAGQEILVQIAKEPLGKKGARITSHVALPGRFLVYMPTVNHIGVSRRIASAEERSRLRRIVGDAKTPFPGGFIVRTAAEGAAEDEIRADVEFLGRTWEKIRVQSEPRKAPSLLHRDLNLVERILRDYLSSDYAAIWIDNEEEYGKILEFVGRFQPKLVDRVKLYTKTTPIFEEFGIQQELDKALRPKVWLKSGGYIVINHTEALVAIDVNTGKYVGRGSTRLEDTIVKTNLEAVKEIVRQIRLRDLGGIIVLDFIDMEERRNREKVLYAMESALRADRAPSKVLPFNEFGLVAVTRKRTKQALERVLCQPCPYCSGSGMVKSIPTICYEIQAEARKMAADLDATSLTLRVHPEIAKALKTREASLVEELEQNARKSVIIQADPTLHWEQYDIY
jgi:ribonuclease G